MAFDATTLLIIKIVFSILSFISLIGMGIISKAIFNVLNNTITISDGELAVGRIGLGFYWGLCIIATVLTVYLYGFKDLF